MLLLTQYEVYLYICETNKLAALLENEIANNQV